MIITPEVLNEQKNDFTIIDIRSNEERQNFPLLGLDTILSVSYTHLTLPTKLEV